MRKPDIEAFSEEELVGLEESLRERYRRIAVPEPVGVTRDPQVVGDDRRFGVPATVIACAFPAEVLKGWMADGHPYVAELARIGQVDDLPTGTGRSSPARMSWPAAILAAVDPGR